MIEPESLCWWGWRFEPIRSPYGQGLLGVVAPSGAVVEVIGPQARLAHRLLWQCEPDRPEGAAAMRGYSTDN